MTQRLAKAQTLETEPVGPTDAAGHIDWPTVAVLAAAYGLFGVATWFHAALPWWVLVPAFGYLIALHGSLQHEAVHGHPTPWPWVNGALVSPSLWLWLPHGVYRESHLRHHRDEVLTDPMEDPESYYLTAEAWDRLPVPARWLMVANNTALGRLVLGPPLMFARFIRAEIADTRWTGERVFVWAVHIGGTGAVVLWVSGVCGMPIHEYLLVAVYPGVALTLLRSFAEHQADPDPDRRTAIVEAEAPLAFMFLNNNLHIVHHAHPGVPWYRLPALYRLRRPYFVDATGVTPVRGYRSVVSEFLMRPRQSVVHPFHAA